MEELEKPIGNFIIENIQGIELQDVCSLLKLYKKELEDE